MDDRPWLLLNPRREGSARRGRAEDGVQPCGRFDGVQVRVVNVNGKEDGPQPGRHHR